MLKRQLNKLQWMALGLLMIGATTSQIGCSGSGLAAPMMGYALGVLSACLSALAGWGRSRCHEEHVLGCHCSPHAPFIHP